MTVRELINRLEEIEVNQEAEVFIVHVDWDIKNVTIDKERVLLS